MEINDDEWCKYFIEGITFSALPFMIEAVGKMASELYGMKYCEKGRWWYGEWEGDRRKVINIDVPGGNTRDICWGWNYSYIPHSTDKGTFKYARTEKAFAIDAGDNFVRHTEYIKLVNDDQAMERVRLSRKYSLPRWANDAEAARSYMETVCSRNIPFIKEYFDRTKTDRDVIEDIDRLSYDSSDSVYYSLWGNNYIKAFILARNGGIDEAEKILSGYSEKVLEKLRQVYEDGLNKSK